ncbi:MAG: hypothetical protein A3C08_03245 [Candidatus Taylorbacteria bacterium RIFCSPHIGHO2_02_FULL_47_18]|uniref:Methyltransferase type 11 domain-containing protein n=1 Tax=Candidatus Taylorbacteria bacterium RIFCSPLOWO2_01_FULL_48_100 TaxID=1802322 RepID=A0A1G2NCH0_9BACT|nr:MAG: hypothetical protein A3C08_03245 [Candidatus Taylorbacteria bacterium RIFCSPHIGHO2_02_FULL_47_18]OHA33753.1 MAG: hypothetical protein A2938_00395 [Candidatus Taylorbacteria bacterium RIFCSPLOWO2_01_FULL_48_100]OHA41078.1 MAG: hypothetical protein A3J31_03260 [Candidatus Taylorbacteria bacterium RIFCSPLOWO2_02_FULL_48_16]OHA45675.1 MAG: hypothetical protein A3H13_00220 [Candidatus Taylorbacteria bacterium RIFCSPLOWO2_12_FULL_48_11]
MSLKRLLYFYYIARGFCSSLFRGHSARRFAHVRAVYERNYVQESNHMFLHKKRKFYVRGKLLVLPVWEYKRFLLLRFAEIVKHFGAATVLELGSGRGLNLLALAVLVPYLKEACGIELSGEGVRAAEENVERPPFEELQLLTGVSREEIERRIRSVHFQFTEGSIIEPHCAPASVDVVFSNSVIEQLPRDYLNAFREARCAARLGSFFSEPFREAQRNPFLLMYLRNIDYFRSSYREAEKAGWRVHSFEIPDMQKFDFNTGILVCKPSS